MVTVGAAEVEAEVEGLAVVGVRIEEGVEITRGNVHGKTSTRRATLIIIEREGTIRKCRGRALSVVPPADRTLLFTYTSRLLNLILTPHSLTSRINSPAPCRADVSA